MSELEELHEGAEHARANPELMRVSFTMAILAVLVALATLLGHRAHTEELLFQTRAADLWAEYQAKNIRYTIYEVISESASAQSKSMKHQVEGWEAKAAKLEKDKEDLQKEARKLEEEVAIEQKRANRCDISEAILEMALVVTSISLLTRKTIFWSAGVVLGVMGMVAMLSAFM